MRKIMAGFVFLLLLGAVHSTTAVGAPESPLADAGLDQTVSRGTTVYLDGTGSRDPDGSSLTYEWSIETPSGAMITPTPPGEPRPQFTATGVGTYNVTLTVTDGDGRTSTDWLHVYVEPGTAPTVDVDGPGTLRVGDSGRYTARIDAGTADLEYVIWRANDEVVANQSLAGERATETVSRTFPSAGERTISATVHDADGLTGRDSVTASVERVEPSGPSMANANDPTIRGPQLVTGDVPLAGTYSLAGVTDGDVASVRWSGTTRTYGRGATERIGWTPGDHRLYAVVDYADGSRDVARFPDGSTRVIADPKPAIWIGNVSTSDGLSGSPRATDGYGNLRTLTVEVNGREVSSAEINPLELYQPGTGYTLERSFRYEDVRPEEPHTVTVVATDARGQRTTETIEKTPVGSPEIIQSEFVNDPVDSYHERIAADRYAAHHVLRVDLNGVNPEKVDVRYLPAKVDDTHHLQTDHYFDRRVYNEDTDVLRIDSYWSANVPGDYPIHTGWSLRGNGDTSSQEGELSTLEVHGSKPEIRYEVIDDGTVHDKRSWGMVIDASDSFDPDGTDLRYRWGHGANPIVADNSTAKFDSWQRASLTLIDEDDQTARVTYDYLNRYNPGIERVEPLSDEPYKPNETVKVRVFTQPYKLTKERYEVPLGIELRGATGTITEWQAIKVDNGECNVQDCSHPGIDDEDELNINNRRYSYYTGVIELDASAFADGTTDPTVVVYNEENPERTAKTEPISGVNVLTEGSRFWDNVSVANLEYAVEKPLVSYVTTQSEAARDAYIDDGYAIENVETGTEFVLEKLVQTQEAAYETRTRTFRQSRMRDLFVSENPDWQDGGSYTTTTNWTTTETEWRDTKEGKGTFTGDTRRVQTEPAEYRTKKEYEYDYEVERTGTRTDQRTRPVSVRKTGTRTVTKCNRYVGCYESTRTYSYWTTEYVRYTVTETYTYTVTRTDSYWAYSRGGYDHRFTGRTKRIKVDDAKYTTQYEFRYDVEHTERVRYYEATLRVQTQEAEYEWKNRKTVKDETAAKRLTRLSGDWRVGDTRPTPKWTLTKQTGVKDAVVDSYSNPSYVTETRATVTGDVKQKYLNTETSGVVTEDLGTKTKEFTTDRALSEDEIVAEFSGTRDNDEPLSADDSRWCELKNNCG